MAVADCALENIDVCSIYVRKPGGEFIDQLFLRSGWCQSKKWVCQRLGSIGMDRQSQSVCSCV